VGGSSVAALLVRYAFVHKLAVAGPQVTKMKRNASYSMDVPICFLIEFLFVCLRSMKCGPPTRHLPSSSSSFSSSTGSYGVESLQSVVMARQWRKARDCERVRQPLALRVPPP